MKHLSTDQKLAFAETALDKLSLVALAVTIATLDFRFVGWLGVYLTLFAMEVAVWAMRRRRCQAARAEENAKLRDEWNRLHEQLHARHAGGFRSRGGARFER